MNSSNLVYLSVNNDEPITVTREIAAQIRDAAPAGTIIETRPVSPLPPAPRLILTIEDLNDADVADMHGFSDDESLDDQGYESQGLYEFDPSDVDGELAAA